MDIENIFAVCILVLIAALALLCAVAIPRALYIESKCLEYGYPEATMTYSLKGYCIKLMSEGGSVSVPLDEIISQTGA